MENTKWIKIIGDQFLRGNEHVGALEHEIVVVVVVLFNLRARKGKLWTDVPLRENNEMRKRIKETT
jgi:hypothetical protein